MENFTNEARKVMHMVEVLARRIENEENVKEYFIEAYNYLDGDDAIPVALAYIHNELTN